MSDYNLPELLKIQEWALTSPEFDLRHWARKNHCGTTLCLAGKAVVDAGFEIDWSVDGSYASLCVDPADSKLVAIDVAAREHLGLSHAEAQALFTPDLENYAMRAANTQDPLTLDTTEVEEKFAMSFLSYLITRASANAKTGPSGWDIGHMEVESIQEFKDDWAHDHWDELKMTKIEGMG